MGIAGPSSGLRKNSQKILPSAVIPSALRLSVLWLSDKSYICMTSKQTARSFGVWLFVDRDPWNAMHECSPCQLATDPLTKAEHVQSSTPKSFGFKMHVHYAGPENNVSRVKLVDTYSKWPKFFLQLPTFGYNLARTHCFSWSQNPPSVSLTLILRPPLLMTSLNSY